MDANMIEEITQLIQSERELHKDTPFLSEYENGVNSGKNDFMDDLEGILSKYGVKGYIEEERTIYGKVPSMNQTYGVVKADTK